MTTTITIKVKQEPCPDWPDGWAVFKYTDESLASEHWAFLCASRYHVPTRPFGDRKIAEWWEHGGLIKKLYGKEEI